MLSFKPPDTQPILDLIPTDLLKEWPESRQGHIQVNLYNTER